MEVRKRSSVNIFLLFVNSVLFLESHVFIGLKQMWKIKFYKKKTDPEHSEPAFRFVVRYAFIVRSAFGDLLVL